MREIKFRGLYKEELVYSDAVGLAEFWKAVDQLEIIGVEQFTGLRDKNGKEIYEGDIVRHIDGGKNVIVYQAPSFVMKKNKKAKKWQEFIFHYDDLQACEIVGNIHENPELLNAKTDRAA